MVAKIKPSILVLIVLILASISLAFSGFYFLQRERQNSMTLQKTVDELTIKYSQGEKKFDEAQKSIAALESKLSEAKTKIAALTDQLEAEKLAKEDALKETDGSRAALEEEKKLKSGLEEKFASAQEESKKLKLELRDLEEKRSSLEKKISELENKLKSGVELGTIVVNPENAQQAPEAVQPATAATTVPTPAEKKDSGASPAAGAAQPKDGKVLVVNKDYNFAVINLGSEDGIALGDVFSIYHNNKYIGDVKVEKVHDSMAAAAFGASDLKDKVSEGDKVVLKAK